MVVRLTMLAAVLLGLVIVVTAIAMTRPAATVPAGLHSVWCVKPGYPRDLALPYVVGPGTGLSGCPAGLRQVTP